MITEATPHVSEIARLHVRLIDFRVDQIQPLALRAPEVTLGAPWDTGVDIWNLGCLIIEFTHGSVMFRETPSKKGIRTLEDDHLAKIVEILGPIPPNLLMKGRRTAELLDEQGKFLRIPKLSLASLKRVLNGDIMPLMKPPDMPDDEIDVFIDFVRGMLQIDPMARKSAAQLLQHEWLS
ncbi:hypothetical protein E4U35_003552 [Claviceps purpurea]|nr:hypothetical protein E4U35_003552 [Claviceps purpurea]